MSLPEIRCVARCATRASYCRLLIGLLVAATTFTIGVWLGGHEDRVEVVRTINSTTVVMDTRLVSVPYSPVTHKYDLFPSPEGAAQEFELQLREAGDYRDLRACHDKNGTSIGQRVLLINPGGRDNAPNWRVVWTVRNENSSELFSLESNSLSELRLIERVPRPNWKLCF